MKISIKKQPIPIIKVSGEIDHYTAGPVEQAIRDILLESNKLILDFSDSKYLDSAGVNLVFFASKSIYEKNGHVALVIKSPGVKRILEIAGVDAMPNVTIFNDLKEALAAQYPEK